MTEHPFQSANFQFQYGGAGAAHCNTKPPQLITRVHSFTCAPPSRSCCCPYISALTIVFSSLRSNFPNSLESIFLSAYAAWLRLQVPKVHCGWKASRNRKKRSSSVIAQPKRYVSNPRRLYHVCECHLQTPRRQGSGPQNRRAPSR